MMVPAQAPAAPLATTETRLGLASKEARRRLIADGPNAVAPPPPQPLIVRIGHQLADPLVVLLIVAFGVTLLVRDMTDAVIIALVVIVNTGIGVAQEVRADRAIAALDRMAAPTARVVRDGVDVVVPAAEVVRGDLVRLEAGDIVPADLQLSVAHHLRLDESALTGESVPVDRTAEQRARAGTVVVAGRGVGVVTDVGAASGLGRIAALVAATRPGPTPLQRRLAALSRVLGLAAVLLSALVLAVGMFMGRPFIDMAITSVSLVVAAVPESLPAVVTVALAIAAKRMAARRAIPRRLHAVETLGSVTVIASDKTGTLTEGKMAVQRAVDRDGVEYAVTGHGYEPDGVIAASAGGSSTSAPLIDLARAGMLCSDASLAAPSEQDPLWRAIGDPMEAALVTFANRCGLAPERERSLWPRVAERPFDQLTRRMTTVHSEPGGGQYVICKGAPEVVLAPPIVEVTPTDALVAAERLAAAGLRVLAVAAASLPDGPVPEPPTGLTFLGLVAVGDPVREQAPAIARDFERAGIRLLLITGDHPGTAAAVGERLGIWRDGDDMHRGDTGAPDADRANRVRVFARTQPDQKLDIIAGLQAYGHVVAMAGDGVNDAPALRRADIGVAMGGGTEVARQAADLVLIDDNLATVAVAVGEGRRIYDNIRRFLHYAVAGGVAEILVMLAGPFLGLAVPLLPAQILWVNLLTHGIPGVALGAEPAEPDLMRRPPRPPEESVLGAGLGQAIVGTGLLLGATVLGAGVIAHNLGRPWQSVVFVVLGLAQLGIALAVRATRTPGGERNPGLALAVGLSALLQVAGVLVEPLRTLLGTEALTLADLIVCAVASSLPALVLLVRRRWRRIRSRP